MSVEAFEAPGWVRLIERELRVEARSVGTRRFLFLCALTSFAILIGLLILGAAAGERINGALYFNTLVIPLMVYSVGCGAFLTADSISAERRERTLPQLFLSNLWAGEIVVGKLVSSSLRAFFGLIACFPSFAFSLFFGGVTGGEFWRTSLALVVAMVYSVAFGIFVSAGLRESQNNLMRVALGLIALSGAGLLLDLLGRRVGLGLPDFFLWISPFYAFRHGLEPFYGMLAGSGGGGYWASIWTMFGMACLFVSLASWILARNWRLAERSNRKVASKPVDHGTKLKNETQVYDTVAPYQMLVLSRTRIDWKEKLGLGALWAVFVVGLGYNIINGIRGFPLGCMIAFGASFLMGLMVKWRWVTLCAAGAAQDIRGGFLQTIAASPHPVGGLWRERMTAIRTRLIPACVATMGTHLILAVAFTVFSDPLSVSRGDLVVFYSFFIGGAMRFAADVWALGPLGIYLAYQGGRPGLAAGKAFLRVQAVSYGGLALTLFFLFAAQPDEDLFSVIWFFWALATSAWAINQGMQARLALSKRSAELIQSAPVT